MIGLGTGGYGSPQHDKPECWSDVCDNGTVAEQAILQWLELGGRRIDDATSYVYAKIMHALRATLRCGETAQENRGRSSNHTPPPPAARSVMLSRWLLRAVPVVAGRNLLIVLEFSYVYTVCVVILLHVFVAVADVCVSLLFVAFS